MNVEKLLCYAQKHLHLGGYDVTYCRNILLKFLRLDAPGEELSPAEVYRIESLSVPDEPIEELESYLRENGIGETGEEENASAFVMALLSPRPEEVNRVFKGLYDTEGPESACRYLYELSIKNNYIHKTAIGKNVVWKKEYPDNRLELTINLSKPEKDNKDIRKALREVSSGYPKCALCKQNLGFYGDGKTPPRQNIRFVPLTIAGERWFMQYSPYLYYDEHCIVIAERHRNMTVNETTFGKLLDFVDIFPNYFVGSNASLPIVGGSILSHEHYQGGGHRMPLHFAGVAKVYAGAFDGVKVSRVNWYNSVVRLTSPDRAKVTEAAALVLTKYNDYSDNAVGLLCKTAEQHNAITPVARKENGEYVLDIILRNNRTDERYPDGIFHAHPERHNIKKEGIGLIEAMGLFILPGRLQKQMEQLAAALSGGTELPEEIARHAEMYRELRAEKERYTPEEADAAIREYINETCRSILVDTAVFKPDAQGEAAFERFMRHCFG